MTGQSILITGCSSGIGLAVARGLQARGYRVIAAARKREDVERLKTEEKLQTVQLDLNDSDSLQRALQQTLELTEGTLDALFNNAAYGLQGALEEISRTDLRAQFETNVFGTHELTNLVLPVMRRQGHGRIVQTSSIIGLVSMPYSGAYSASKFALEGLSDALRRELRGSGIHLSLIEPGSIATRFRENAYAVFKDTIAIEESPHSKNYQRITAKFQQETTRQPEKKLFRAGPEAVLKKVIHALESPRPKIRYYVTLPSYLMAYARRILPDRSMDWIIAQRFK